MQTQWSTRYRSQGNQMQIRLLYKIQANLILSMFIILFSNTVFAQWNCEKDFKAVGDEWGYQKCIKDNAEKNTVENNNKNNEIISRYKKLASNDSVAQVLNYSNNCPESGCNDSTWYPIDGKNCIYGYAEIERGSVKTSQKLNLNELNPRNITFEKNLPDNSFATLNSLDNFGVGNYVKHGNQLLFASNVNNFDRVKNGWRLIYSKYCTGNKKEF